MSGVPTATSTAQVPWAISGNLGAQICETHTGFVILLGEKAYKAKKPITTDFLDFSTTDRRIRACEREVALNKRLAPDSYLGVGYFTDPDGDSAEPVIVMRRYADSTRLASLVKSGEPVDQHLAAIAGTLARFHSEAARGPTIDAQGTAEAVLGRWQQNVSEMQRFADTVIPRESIDEVERLAAQFVSGRADLFTQRLSDRRVVDGHADLLADDVFCLPDGPAVLDCLEFDDQLRYVDGIDDAAFLAMDLEFLGRKDLADYFLAEYKMRTHDPAPRALTDFYIAYRAEVRAKVDCVRVTQGHQEAAADACRHMNIALEHLRAGTVRLIIVGGGPGTGKTTVAHALAERIGAEVISTDDVRQELVRTGVISGKTGDLNAGLYAPENVAVVYDEVLRSAHVLLSGGSSVILDGTWRDSRQRARARGLADQTTARIVEFTCSVTAEEASERIQDRQASTSDATPEIAAALAAHHDETPESYRLDTSRALAESVQEAQKACCRAI